MRSVIKILGIAAGSFIYSLGINYFIVANGLAEGGFVGISILGLYLLKIPLGVSFFLLNIPLFLIGWKLFGKKFIFKTVLGVVFVSIFSELTKGWQSPMSDKLLAALYGGVINGIGLGIIFRSGATTGGSDIIGRIVGHYFGYSMGRTLFAIDVIVIGVIALIIGKETAMYSLIALFVASRVIDMVLEGPASSRACLIISDHTQKIADAISQILERGTTLLEGKGGYTGKNKEILYCVVSREEIGRIQQIVRDIDPSAFLVIYDVHDVIGEGFSPLKATS
jgi:uncharacterized membrane-anchored protein YitT (DUF2179 family)